MLVLLTLCSGGEPEAQGVQGKLFPGPPAGHSEARIEADWFIQALAFSCSDKPPHLDLAINDQAAAPVPGPLWWAVCHPEGRAAGQLLCLLLRSISVTTAQWSQDCGILKLPI